MIVALFWLAALLPFFEGTKEDFKVSIQTSEPIFSQDGTFQITLKTNHPDLYSLSKDEIRAEIMQPGENGIYPFYLALEKENGNELNFTLKPQFPGEIPLPLKKLTFTAKDKPAVQFSLPPLTLNVIETPPASTNFALAPLMPLIPGDPLELSLKLHQELYDQDLSKENSAILKAHTFPWLRVLATLGIMSLLPFALITWMKSRKPRLVIPSTKTIIEELRQLQQGPLNNPRELSFQIAALFKKGFDPILNKNAAPMTFQELSAKLQERLPMESKEKIEHLFQELEKMQFQSETPSKEEVETTLEEAAATLSRF